MNLEQQVCSLDLAKRLKELGVKQDSAWFWGHNSEKAQKKKKKPEWSLSLARETLSDEQSAGRERYSAFTVAELGEIVLAHHETLIQIAKGKMFGGKGFDIPKGDEDFLRWMLSADSWAKMFIYLIENKLI